MAYRVTLNESGKSFEVEDGEIVLDAAERAGLILTYSCRSGTCRACITRIISGRIEHDPEFANFLSIDRGEMAAGFRLLCSAFALSDAEIDR